MGKHTDRAHAILSASISERWMNCTPSAQLENKFGEKKDSPYAKEGVLAHELAELTIKYQLEMLNESTFLDRLGKLMNSEFYTDDMPDEVQKYVDFCLEQYQSAKVNTPDAKILIEQKIDLTDYIPEGFGSNDAIIIADGIMEVVDLKYGKGVVVRAEHNKQLMVYGLGAHAKFALMYDIREVRLTIVQPRLDSISSWSISTEDLLSWAENELKPLAKIAFKGEGELKTGDWCRFCSVKNRCPKLAEDSMSLAIHEFSAPTLLSDSDIGEILMKAQLISDWVSGIREYALAKAIAGKKWPGHKLVAGISRRKWIDEAVAVEKIRQEFPGCEDDDIYNYKLKSITDLEKKFGKADFSAKLNDVIIKPPGTPTLVPDSDKRPALGIEQAKIDFKS